MFVTVHTLVYVYGLVLCSFGNSTKRRADDYYLNYDYEIRNNTINIEFKPDSLILPNPENIDSKYTVDVLPNVELPDDSLADTDLKDHDFIDNIMYVYYGSHNRISSGYGSETIIIGSVLSCAAQLLTIFCVLLRKNVNGKREMKLMFLHLVCCFCTSNLLFMLGVYATKSALKCLIISLVLHYLHLLTAIWLFLYCYYIYQRVSTCKPVNIKYYSMIAYGTPIFLTFMSYIVAPHSYESRRFCFISVQKGMILNYMLPVSILIVLTTIYSLNGLRKINLELSKLEFSSSAESLSALKNELDLTGEKKSDYSQDGEVASLRESRTCLKMLCVVQTGYDIVWFIVVLALENVNENYSMSIIYAVTSCILNWYIFIKTKSFFPTINIRSHLIDDVVNAEPNVSESTTVDISRIGSSDSIPLLNSESCTEMKELRPDYISTISS
ncbi:unnamed protein product [Brassicogethes aeneus]|uniref:G-protein coupled receptors family 2 profile 2 domain-containing protein n=1 Tax=Brassicogethes aeneus TaxID=1431903 RepID=A0A9P0ANI4_BRAAE|nr:unnamed protein product [Brassicogethes aeneus]